MANLPPYPGTPRWVKLSGVFAGALVLLLVTLMLLAGGNHGPGRHMVSSDADRQASSSDAAAEPPSSDASLGDNRAADGGR